MTNLTIENLFVKSEKTSQKIDANIRIAQDLVGNLENLLKSYDKLLTDIKAVKL